MLRAGDSTDVDVRVQAETGKKTVSDSANAAKGPIITVYLESPWPLRGTSHRQTASAVANHLS